jgi:PAS domain S-box-containing protein
MVHRSVAVRPLYTENGHAGPTTFLSLAAALTILFLALLNFHQMMRMQAVIEGSSSGLATTTLLLRLFGVVAVVVVGYYGVYKPIRRRRSEAASGLKEAAGQPAAQVGETGFVIETFHELVRTLKGKESELERLRRRAEDRAAHVEDYNENILQSVASGVVTFDRDRRVTTCNAAAEKILGLRAGEAVGCDCEEVFGPDGRIGQLLTRSLESRESVSRQELELRRRDGRRIWVGVSLSLLRDRSGEPIGSTVVFTDLTEIKTLQRQVEFKRRLEELGEISAGIAHEFRNSMGTIVGLAKLLSKRVGADSPHRETVEGMLRELTAMDRLIEELLGLGRATALNVQPVPIEPLLRSVTDQILSSRRESASGRCRVAWSIGAGLVQAAGDEILLQRVFGNLVQNAVEAMPDGGEVIVSAGVVGSDAKSGPTAIEVGITDNGPGIPKEQLDRIFLPFYTTKERGTGMGLALVHKIVSAHGGRIEVESEEGKGTTFRITLPAWKNG